MLRGFLLWASQNEQLRRRLPRHRFFRKAVRRFMPGENVEDALTEAKRLQQGKIAAIFTLLGENVADTAEAEKVARHYTDVLTEIQRRQLDSEVSVKLTQLGLDLDPDVALRKLESIVTRARELKAGIVWIDMEASPYVDRTLDVFRRVRKNHQNAGLCLQSYLYRTGNDLKSLLPITSTIRLVKGAYAEPKNIAFPQKSEVDRNYMKLALLLLENAIREDGGRPAFATHDDRLIHQIQQAAQEKGIDRSSYEFEMLYGIRRQLQTQLVNSGYRMRVLISYGTEWFPWYMRRLAERPANLWFVIKNLFAS